MPDSPVEYELRCMENREVEPHQTKASNHTRMTAFKQALQNLGENLKEDFNALRWIPLLWWLLAHLGTLAGVAILLRYLVLITTVPIFAPSGVCMPDGSFNAGLDPYNMWSSSGFFQITLGFGELSFGTAKFIDVAWDVVSCFI
jgi:hypothetical protein